jgi:hypothetical protein
MALKADPDTSHRSVRHLSKYQRMHASKVPTEPLIYCFLEVVSSRIAMTLEETTASAWKKQQSGIRNPGHYNRYACSQSPEDQSTMAMNLPKAIAYTWTGFKVAIRGFFSHKVKTF